MIICPLSHMTVKPSQPQRSAIHKIRRSVHPPPRFYNRGKYHILRYLLQIILIVSADKNCLSLSFYHPVHHVFPVLPLIKYNIEIFCPAIVFFYRDSVASSYDKRPHTDSSWLKSKRLPVFKALVYKRAKLFNFNRFVNMPSLPFLYTHI